MSEGTNIARETASLVSSDAKQLISEIRCPASRMNDSPLVRAIDCIDRLAGAVNEICYAVECLQNEVSELTRRLDKLERSTKGGW